ncbi:nuclease [Haloplanus rubicundus]|uniref:Nuclease n=1 Tax=Haloplanus rubicundus TaxID=1547898 RepID=A0A345E524_9EURY|nr:DNA double-strand break repair nuclease NurA [Haloplanus rubicundus]AXG07296.1 nuclease [Haloplanus rubicundus]AXG10697.1 nuclease [Haloplanus rubicundus]
MTLDPVHVEEVADLAGLLGRRVDDGDHDDLARTAFEEWLDPLRVDGRTVLDPLGERRLRAVAVDDVALVDTPYPTVHGLDSGTINPTTFKNGLVLDVAHAAMAADPSDLDLHRARSLVTTVHANDPTLSLGTDWVRRDEGYFRRKILHAPRVNRYAEGVVHALALYLAESSHALEHADVVSDCLLLDGPLYPKELLNWQDRDAELGALTTEAKPRAIVENYVRLVERMLDRDVALGGFVKNPSAKLITRALREKGVDAPWVDDTAFFTRLLEPSDDSDDTAGHRLTFTNWFRSRGGSDRTLAADGDALGVERRRDPADYEVTFFVVYDPREDLCYRVEAPAGLTRDADARDRLTRQILRDVAVSRGPPTVVERADALARIGVDEKAALRRKFEERLDSAFVRTYDDVRWDVEF